MPRGRIILKAISESKKLSMLQSDGARLLYTWLIPHLDVAGCFSGDPKVINGKVFTRLSKSDEDVEGYLVDLEKNGLVQRYEANGDIFIIVPDFKEKQPYLDPKREGKSIIPPLAPELLASNSRVTQPQYKYKSKYKYKDKDNRGVALQAAPPDEIREFLKAWGDTWTKTVGKGKTYICNFKKERTIVKDLLRTMTLREISALAEKFFKSDDDFIRRTGYTIGVFKTQIPKLIAGRGPASKTEKILEAARASQERLEREERDGKV